MKCKKCEYATIVERYKDRLGVEHIKVVCFWQICLKERMDKKSVRSCRTE